MRRAIVVGALLAALTLTAATPAEASTTNWLRACSTVHSHPLSTSCTLTPPIQPHRLQYRDAKGAVHTLKTGTAVWAFAKAHSIPCGKTHSASCYGTDEVMGDKFIALSSRTNYTLRFFHA